MTSSSVVLVACGSYNPITLTHLRIFEVARDYVHSTSNDTVIGGIVSPVHDAYSKKDLVSAEHRCTMLRLALKSSDWIKLSEWEVNQEGWTKTRMTLKYYQECINAYLDNRQNSDYLDGSAISWLPNIILNKINNQDVTDAVNSNYNYNNIKYDNNQRVKVKLLCGGDLLESFAVPGLWKDSDIEQILSEHGLVVVTRSGTNPEKFIYESDLLTRLKRNITIVTNWVPNEVSSTMIRRLLRRGESVKYLIEDSVISYIRQNGLFGATATDTTKYIPSYISLKPCIVTPSPSPNDVVMKSPSEFQMQKGDSIKQSSNISSKIINYLIGVDDVDSEDVYTSASVDNHPKRLRLTDKVSSTGDLKPRPFCPENDAGSSSKLPHKSMKVITDLSGVHKIVSGKKKVCDFDPADEVFIYYDDRDSTSDPCSDDLSKNFESLVIAKKKDRAEPRSPLRSYDEVVKFIFSKHGIQVISDKETIV